MLLLQRYEVVPRAGGGTTRYLVLWGRDGRASGTAALGQAGRSPPLQCGELPSSERVSLGIPSPPTVAV